MSAHASTTVSRSREVKCHGMSVVGAKGLGRNGGENMLPPPSPQAGRQGKANGKAKFFTTHYLVMDGQNSVGKKVAAVPTGATHSKGRAAFLSITFLLPPGRQQEKGNRGKCAGSAQYVVYIGRCESHVQHLPKSTSFPRDGRCREAGIFLLQQKHNGAGRKGAGLPPVQAGSSPAMHRHGKIRERVHKVCSPSSPVIKSPSSPTPSSPLKEGGQARQLKAGRQEEGKVKVACVLRCV